MTGDSPAAQGAINMDIAVGDDLCTGIDGADDDEIGPFGVNAAAGAHRLGHQHGIAAAAAKIRCRGGGFGGGGWCIFGRGRGGAGGGAHGGEAGRRGRLAHRRRAADHADGHDLQTAQPGNQPGKIHLRRRDLQIIEADGNGREAQEAWGATELIAQRGQHNLRPAIEQAQHQQIEIPRTQAEGIGPWQRMRIRLGGG
jgi:hypothetical protein